MTHSRASGERTRPAEDQRPIKVPADYPPRARAWTARADDETLVVWPMWAGDTFLYDPDDAPNIGELVIVTTDDGDGTVARYTPDLAPEVAGVVFEVRRSLKSSARNDDQPSNLRRRVLERLAREQAG